MKILFVSLQLPSKLHGGGVHLYNLLKELAKRNQVFLISRMNSDDKEDMFCLKNICKEIYIFEKVRILKSPVKFLQNYLFSFQKTINRVIRKHSIDIVQYEYTLAGMYLLMTKHGAKVINEHDLTYESYLSRSKIQKKYLKKLKYLWQGYSFKLIEKLILKKSDLVLVKSNSDRKKVRNLFSRDNVKILPIGLNVSEYNHSKITSYGEPSLLFVGNFRHPPNIDSLVFFLEEIFSKIVFRVPKVVLYVVGNRAPKLESRNQKNIKIVGKVEDVKEYFRKCQVFVAPVRWGSGQKVKILEALACGIPVVTTSVGAYGIEGKSGLLVHDEPKKFSSEVISLLGDKKRRQRLSLLGQKYIKNNFNIEQIVKNLEKNYLEIIENDKID